VIEKQIKFINAWKLFILVIDLKSDLAALSLYLLLKPESSPSLP